MVFTARRMTVTFEDRNQRRRQFTVVMRLKTSTNTTHAKYEHVQSTNQILLSLNTVLQPLAKNFVQYYCFGNVNRWNYNVARKKVNQIIHKFVIVIKNEK